MRLQLIATLALSCVLTSTAMADWGADIESLRASGGDSAATGNTMEAPQGAVYCGGGGIKGQIELERGVRFLS